MSRTPSVRMDADDKATLNLLAQNPAVVQRLLLLCEHRTDAEESTLHSIAEGALLDTDLRSKALVQLGRVELLKELSTQLRLLLKKS